MKSQIPKTAIKVFEGVVFEVWQWEQEQFDGSFKTFEMLSRTDSVTMIVTVAGEKILLLDEEQPGRAPFITLPAGELEKDELPLIGAMRELIEETGYTSDDWEEWYQSGIGSRIAYTNHFYIARNAQKTVEQHLDNGGEKITVREIDFEQFIALKDEQHFRNKDLLHILEKAAGNKEFKENLRQKIFNSV
ncbi:MAG: hypothetical protein RI996_130 [Candidatus Parcubacteria bacterium]|jgi:ADP-ribose pyrophosphatase